MIVPDTNLLVYAYDAGSVHHQKAGVWWAACMNGSEAVGLPAPVVFGFMRLVTHPRVFQQPFSVSTAASRVRSWLARPHVRVIIPGETHPEAVIRLLEQAGTAGNLTTDAQIAALALQDSGVVHSNDTDFQRFPGLRWFNPLTGKGGKA